MHGRTLPLLVVHLGLLPFSLLLASACHAGCCCCRCCCIHCFCRLLLVGANRCYCHYVGVLTFYFYHQ